MIRAVKSLHDSAKTSVRSAYSERFGVRVGEHQRFL